MHFTDLHTLAHTRTHTTHPHPHPHTHTYTHSDTRTLMKRRGGRHKGMTLQAASNNPAVTATHPLTNKIPDASTFKPASARQPRPKSSECFSSRPNPRRTQSVFIDTGSLKIPAGRGGRPYRRVHTDDRVSPASVITSTPTWTHLDAPQRLGL